MSGIDYEEWMQALEIARHKEADKIPDGWKTKTQLCDIWRMNETNTRKNLNILESQGLIEKRKFRIFSGERGIYPVVHYRFKKK